MRIHVLITLLSIGCWTLKENLRKTFLPSNCRLHKIVNDIFLFLEI